LRERGGLDEKNKGKRRIRDYAREGRTGKKRIK
jgi:hypothetical protein